MITEKIRIDNHGNGVEKVLELTDKVGAFGGLSHKETVRLRLLAEELIGVMRGIAGDIEADFWMEQEEKTSILHLKSDVVMNQEMRKRFIDISTSGKNAAVKGFMSRIRESIAIALLPVDDEIPIVQSVSLGFMNMGEMDAYNNNVDSYMWSLQNYKEALDENDDEESKEAWDELEKSIVASLADDVKVSVKGTLVEISMYKNFDN